MAVLPTYSAVHALKTLRGLAPRQAFDALAVLIDGAEDRSDAEAIHRAARFCAQLRSRKWSSRLSSQQRALVHYFESNAWSASARLSWSSASDHWKWDQPEILKQLLSLRRAARSVGFRELSEVRQCQVHTNLANALNWLGRTVEAFEHWARALSIDATFAMALGNRGIGLITYARFTHDDGHQLLILREARDSLAAIDPSEIEASAEAGFASHLHSLQAFLENADLGVDVDWDRPSLGRSKREQTYRSWCLRQRLFINPLNDVWQRPLVAHDVTFLPPLSTPPGPGMPTIVGAFNNLKQEYATARLMLFEGLTQERPHFSDRGVRLINTLDYPSYGLGREQVKVAFRMAYSILDKIGFIVNEYFSLEIKPKDVSFRLLWFTNQNPKQGLRDDLAARPNLPLRGLYWISRDLFDAGSGLNTAAEPDARHLQLVRNHIEHRYLKVHDSEWAGPDDESSFTDRLAYSIRRDDLERKALRMLKLARAGLLHLVLAIRVEESRRKPASGAEKGLTLPMHLDNFDDRWKV